MADLIHFNRAIPLLRIGRLHLWPYRGWRPRLPFMRRQIGGWAFGAGYLLGLWEDSDG